jgi:hypothetical protein
MLKGLKAFHRIDNKTVFSNNGGGEMVLTVKSEERRKMTREEVAKK